MTKPCKGALLAACAVLCLPYVANAATVANQGGSAVAATSLGVVRRKPRRMSAAARKRIGDAARKRWAALRAAQGTDKPATVKRRKRHLSPEGRRRIIEATKRRWAAKRAADAALAARTRA